MAMDAGTYTWSVPVNSQATDVALGGSLTAGDKGFFLATEGVDVVEIGAIAATGPIGGAFAFTAAVAPNIGGAYAVQATCSLGSALQAAQVLRKSVKIHLDKGQVLRLTVSVASATGSGQLYAKVYPAGSRSADNISVT